MSNDSNQNHESPKASGKLLAIVWVAIIAMAIGLLYATVGPWVPLLWFMLTDNGRM
jgi:hypothetical protein